MRKTTFVAITSIALLGFSAAASADPVSEVWDCKLEKNATLADAQAINKKWLAFMKANVSEEITSAAATAVVGELDEFLYVDSYPDLATWAAGKEALATEAGQEVESLFDGIMECDENTLYRVQSSE